MTKRPQSFPHNGVYARLGRSRIHGVGVMAIRNIPAGTNIFANDAVELVWVDESSLEDANLTDAARQLYADFGIAVAGRIGCPVNFNSLTPGWHCNEPPAGSEPNIAIDKELNFIARRLIRIGEELTISYAELAASQSEN